MQKQLVCLLVSGSLSNRHPPHHLRCTVPICKVVLVVKILIPTITINIKSIVIIIICTKIDQTKITNPNFPSAIAANS